MAEITILHNPRCSTSRAALAAAEGLEVEVVDYQKQPLDEAGWLHLLGILEDSPSDLVRRDKRFSELGLTDDEVTTAEQVAALLAEHPALAQRPVLIRGDRAIIGRPKDRVPGFLVG